MAKHAVKSNFSSHHLNIFLIIELLENVVYESYCLLQQIDHICIKLFINWL